VPDDDGRLMAEATHAVVLSDLHIGSGAPTCWYQPSVHERALTAAVDWVVGNRDQIREVVLLGDIFDTWTYEPAVDPPAMADIIHANPQLLGPAGPFARLAHTFPGAVKLLLGNHDLSLTHADVELLNVALGAGPGTGAGIELVDCPVLVLRSPGPVRHSVAFAHGHRWCMFNGPDSRLPGDLPVGHLVSRAIAHKVAARVRAGEAPHAALMKDLGNPPAEDHVWPAVKSIWDAGFRIEALRKSVVTALLAAMSKWAGLPETTPIRLGGGQQTTLAQGKTLFADRWQRWRDAYEDRDHDADRAMVADVHGDDLAWFAQRVAFQTSSDLVVMGHTHRVVSGLDLSPVEYVNNGYGCPPDPSLSGDRLTFTVVDVPTARAQLYKVVTGPTSATVLPMAESEAPRVSVVQRGRDFSCYVRIENRSGRVLTRKSYTKSRGWWSVEPPEEIADGERADIWLQDEWGVYGSGGAVSYDDGSGGPPITFKFACPVRGDNVFETSLAGAETRTADGPWTAGPPQASGHPVMARCTAGTRSAGVVIAAGAAAPPPGTECWRPPVPGRRPDLSRQESADFLSTVASIMDGCHIDAARGIVLSHVRFIFNDGRAPMDSSTRPGPAGSVYLSNPPAHLAGLDVFQIDTALYGAFDFVLIKPHGPTGPPPAIGGFLFLPPPGARQLDLVTFNVSKLDLDAAGDCRNDHHAEMQADVWLGHQDAGWQRRIHRISVQNGSRQATSGRRLAYSPCRPCASDLAGLLTRLNATRPAGERVLGRISWADLYRRGTACQHPTTAYSLQLMVDAGWRLQGPLPSGIADTPAVRVREGTDWPWSSEAPEPELPALV
jgi:hypothetical protein